MVVKLINNRNEFTTALATTSEASTAAESTAPLVVIDCFATWCGPCKAIAPKMELYSNTYPSVGFYKIDVDALPDLAQELGVTAMPTFLYFKNGVKVDEVRGAVPPAIEGAIRKHSA